MTAGSDKFLKNIRSKFKVPAYNGMKIKTSKGEIGAICGAEGVMLKVWFESKKKFGYCNPEEVGYIGITLKKE